MTDKQPIDHVLRFEPPWRHSRKTECGRLVTDVASVIERDDLLKKVKEQGQQRAAFSTCMTCWDKTRYAKTWDQDPVAVLRRESRWTHKDDELEAEMRALTLMWQAHRDDFEEAMAGLSDVNDLTAARLKKRKRA